MANGEPDQRGGDTSTDDFLRQLMRSVFSGEEKAAGPSGETDVAEAPEHAREEGVHELDLTEVGTAEDRLAAEESARLREEEPAPAVPPEPEHRPEEPAGSESAPAADLQSPSPDVRMAALQRLLQNASEAPVVGVTARLQDPEPEVRVAAVKVLEAAGDERLLLLLLDSVGDPAEDVREAVRDAFRSRRGSTLTDLLTGELAVPAHVRPAADLLADMGEVEPLLEAAKTGSPEIRRIVSEVLDRTGTVRSLIEALLDRRPDERRIACEQLGGLRSVEAVEPLIARLSDPDRGVRIKAAEALGRIGERGALHALKRAYIWDPDSSVVVAIGEALRKISGVMPGRGDG